MAYRVLAALPLAIVGDEVGLSWLSCCFQNRTICNEAAGMCRTLGHFVASAETEPDAVIRGGVTFSVDGSPSMAGNSMVREAKPSLSNFGQQKAQSINWGYDAVAVFAEKPQGLPSEVCASAWVADVSTAARGATEPHCLTFDAEHLPSQGGVDEPMPSLFDAEHSQAVLVTSGAGQRLLVHADARVAAPNLVDTTTGTALCTFEGPSGVMHPCGSVDFEQQVVATQLDGVAYDTQVFQFVQDLQVMEPPTQVCFKVQFQLKNFPQAPVSWLAAAGEVRGTEGSVNCLNVTTVDGNTAVV